MPVTLEETFRRFFRALLVIHENPGITMTDFTRLLGVSKAAAVNLVESLVKLGLVERRISSRVPPRVALYLTERGECILRCINVEMLKEQKD